MTVVLQPQVKIFEINQHLSLNFTLARVLSSHHFLNLFCLMFRKILLIHLFSI